MPVKSELGRPKSFRWLLGLPLGVVLATAAIVVLASGSASGADPCAPPVTNKVACENTKPGLAPSEWQIDEIGDPSIQGFATSMSTNVGQTVSFKIKTSASKYHINILRLGYYDGDGARLIASNIQPSASLPQTQPSCLTKSETGLIDCGNWGVSASWTVPSSAVSGLYIAQLVRNDTGGESQIFFVVREDSSHSDVVLKTSDSTWEAYNAYGGNSLYSCTVSCPPGEPEGYKAAYAVSYNRPFDGTLVTDNGVSDPFYAEYQLIRFLERNGYDLSYVSQRDLDASGSLLQNHKVFISSAHDEYWSAEERQSVEAARNAGTSLAFFSGNELFWKTRWTNSVDGSNTPYRTLVTYKETHFPSPVDPAEPGTSTTTWRDPRFSPPGDAGRPENNLSGQIFLVNAGTSDIQVPGTFAKLRFWRNTPVSTMTPSQTLTLSPGTGTLGYEWDVNPDNGFRPAGRISMSSTTVNGVQTFTDYGTSVANDTTATHSLSLYRAPSGALVFGSGTVQWSWGLDDTNAWFSSVTNPSGNPPDPTMQQATVNLLADMGAQPATLQSGLIATTKSTDTTAPTASVSAPSNGASLSDGNAVTISGSASDSGGVVAAVEVSTDGGTTWHTANGTTSWTYPWIVHGSPATTIKARAVDDSGNIGAATAGTNVSVNCPCSLFGATVPDTIDAGDGGSVELGVKFRSDVGGTVSGIRFYKAAANTGTHVGSLWAADGTPLAEATFSGESASGWQQVTFANPVTIQANTTYVAGYFAPKGHYSATEWALNNPPATGANNLNSPPLHILTDASSGGNGLYQYESSSVFPSNTYHAENYWVDVMFTPAAPEQVPGQVTGVSASAGLEQATVTWTPPASGGAATGYRITPYKGTTAQTPITLPAPATSKTITGLTGGTAYTFKVAAVNGAGAGPDSAASNSVTPTKATVPGTPTGVSATAGALSATVNWTPPVSDGGSPITGYRITPYLGGVIAQTSVTAAATATSATVPNLTSGISYTFKVAAINAIGTGADSSASNSVTPTGKGPPAAPTGVSAIAKSGGATVSWTAPTSNGGSAITGYRITPFIGTTAQTATTLNSTATSGSVSGLVNGTSYTFKVAAINALGTGPDSAASSAITPYGTIFDLGVPSIVDSADGHGVELGVKFRSDVAGTIEGIRFYKAATNTGTHVGSLWTSGGGLLAQANFSGESASGWQQVKFSAPVSIEANTTYVAGYYAPNGHYSVNGPTLASGVDNPPLHALANSTSPNGVYAYGAAPSFPSDSYQSSNYWVDVLFAPLPPPSAPGQVTGVSATAGLGSANVSWSAPTSGGAPTSYTVTPFIGSTAQTAKTVSGTPPATSTTVSGLTPGTSYTFKVTANNAVGSGPISAASNAVTPGGATVPDAPTGVTAAARNQSALVSWAAPLNDGGSAITGYRITPFIGTAAQTPTTVGGSATSATVSTLTNGTSYTFTVTAINAVGDGVASAISNAVAPRATILEQGVPATVDVADSSAQANGITLGVKFTSDSAGKISGIRFYKAAANTGTHVVSLWTSGGTLLAQATASGESASGWQEASFSSPVSITANTTYVAGYLAPKGHYSATGAGFSSAVNTPPLHAVADATSANGVYVYGGTSTFPTNSYNATNYWVDVMFTP